MRLGDRIGFEVDCKGKSGWCGGHRRPPLFSWVGGAGCAAFFAEDASGAEEDYGDYEDAYHEEAETGVGEYSG